MNNNPNDYNEYNANSGNKYQGYSPSQSRSKTVIAVTVTALVLVILIVAVMVIAMKITKTSMNEKDNDIKGSTKVISVEADSKTEDIQTEDNIEKPSERVIMYIANVENSVYFRSEPIENESNIITTIPFGTAVFFLGNEDPIFAEVEYDGKTGFVKRDYLSVSVPEKPVKAEDNTINML